MKRLALLLLLVVGASASSAQTLEGFKRELATPVGESEVVISEHGDAAEAVDATSRTSQRLRLRGYRVCIFFDNGQDARAGAMEAKQLFEQTFPGVRCYMVYENPYFKVSVGNCLTSGEAIILKGQVAGAFPKAFLKSEELTMADLLQ